jgi:hypothetical protein
VTFIGDKERNTGIPERQYAGTGVRHKEDCSNLFRKSGDISFTSCANPKTADSVVALRVVWDRNYEKFETPASAIN